MFNVPVGVAPALKINTVGLNIVATTQLPFGTFVLAVAPVNAISLPIAKPCATDVVTVTKLPEYVAPDIGIAAPVKINPK